MLPPPPGKRKHSDSMADVGCIGSAYKLAGSKLGHKNNMLVCLYLLGPFVAPLDMARE